MKHGNNKKWIGILGFPLTHSRSREVHLQNIKNAALDYEFRVMEWDVETFDRNIGALKQDPLCVGFSITMPYKQKVVPFADHLDSLASATGVVNCIKNAEGVWYGYNTDGPGFLTAFDEWNPKPPPDTPVIVLGTGATACTISYMLAQVGFKHFIIAARAPEKANYICNKIKNSFSEVNIRCQSLSELSSASFVVNTIPLQTTEVSITAHWYFDVNYHASSSQKTGLSMFLHQADMAFGIWTKDLRN